MASSSASGSELAELKEKMEEQKAAVLDTSQSERSTKVYQRWKSSLQAKAELQLCRRLDGLCLQYCT